jgi:anti-anti-sigma factor
MDMAVEALAPGVVKLVLKGRLDIAGASAIDLQFNAIARSHKAVVVDLGGVSFLASIGIRTLLLGAKTVQRRGGTLILLNPVGGSGTGAGCHGCGRVDADLSRH